MIVLLAYIDKEEQYIYVSNKIQNFNMKRRTREIQKVIENRDRETDIKANRKEKYRKIEIN